MSLHSLLQERKIDEAIENYIDLEPKEYLFSMVVLYGTLEDIKKYHPKLIDYDTFVLDDIIVRRSVSFDNDKIKYVLENDLVSEIAIYQLIKYNYTCIKYVNKDIELNFAKIVDESLVSFRYLVDVFLESGYTYKHIVMSYYNGYNMLAYILDDDKSGKHNCNDLIKLFETLLVFDKTLLIQLFKISRDKTILSSTIGSKTETHKKIIRYVKGRKLVDEILDEDKYLVNIRNNCGKV